jgi:glycosyltransferase involved in cell wall biosynthesis
MGPRKQWHLIVSEYPPQIGGVADYTRQVAEGLAEHGDEVHVWCPKQSQPPSETPGVAVHPSLGRLAPLDLRRTGEALNEYPRPRRLLVQWVPHGYGYRSMNLPFCCWLWDRAHVRGDIVEVMVHEPFLSFGSGGRRQDAAALVHRLMTIVLLNAARRVWVSIPVWAERLRPFFLGRRVPVNWLPVPSNIVCPGEAARAAETDLAIPRFTFGHFGMFGRSITGLLVPVLEALLAGYSGRNLLLMGKGSEEFRQVFVARRPEFSEQVHATGEMEAAELSRSIARCDLMIQPYPDGISSRRGSAMAALCHGRPIVTTVGRLSERLWQEGDAVALAPSGDSVAFIQKTEQLLASSEERRRLGLRARSFYLEHFDLRRTISAIRSETVRDPSPCA